jgi:UDP-N-acetylmuramate dehydrogenase
MNGSSEALIRAFGERARRNVPLAPLTTFRVGGPADWLVDVQGAAELRTLLEIARAGGVPVTLLGGGSNVLVADEGVRGIVVRLRGGQVRALDPGLVRADAGVTINGLVRWTITHALGGIEAWAGTPGTVGGAVYGNAHFQGRLISELVHGVTVAARDGTIAEVPAAAMEFGYDYSRLQRTREILLSADFRVRPGDPAALRAIARESLAFRKRTQPLALSSAGCIFQNPDPAREPVPEGIPASAGALVDRAGLKGASAGGARVSPVHANFIVNDGTATARDILALVRRCKAAVRDRFGVALREEIVYLGFPEGQSDVHSED